MRTDGYAPIGDYAAIGDGRSVGLVAGDGSLDWLCLPDLGAPASFAALLDPERGGHVGLAPAEPFETSRRYVPDTNVLETTFATASGKVKVTDALTLDNGEPPPWTELARAIEGLAGEVRMEWRVQPAFDFARADTRIDGRAGLPIAAAGDQRIAVLSHDAGEPELSADSVTGACTVRAGDRALLGLAGTHGSPIPVPARDEIERRLGWTVEDWRRVAGVCRYQGPWEDAVRRSALALHLLIAAQDGCIVGAATTSLPERVGGDRNYDYRLAWVRDASFSLDVLDRLGYRAQAHQSLAWLLNATSRTHPRLQPIYRLDGTPRAPAVELPLAGYRGSRPVLEGNTAVGQLQLGNYGHLMETVEIYVRAGNRLDSGTAQRLVEIADLVCLTWRNRDSGIWELPDERHYTQSKMGCWTALDRACRLARDGQIPDDRIGEWEIEAEEIRRFVLDGCRRGDGALSRHPDTDDLDAAVLIGARVDFLGQDEPALRATVDAVQAELVDGPFVYRYSGMREQEGAFVACSFWLAEALAALGRFDEADEVMDGIVNAANDVGLLSEEIDPATGDLLGNFPQGLSHLGLCNAALQISDERAARSGGAAAQE
jgi:GH15 family glucan-1,4-alpha-glucosidase